MHHMFFPFLHGFHFLPFYAFSCLFLIPFIFYLVTLNNALAKCAPETRALDPVMIWLCLVPVVGLVLQFLVVNGLATSLRNEYMRRGLPLPEPEPGKQQGLYMCIAVCCCVVPLLNCLAWIPALVLWIMYWVKMAEYSRLLDVQVMMPPTA